MRARHAQTFVNIEFCLQPIEREKIVHNAQPLLQLTEARHFHVFKKLRLTNQKNMQELFSRRFPYLRADVFPLKEWHESFVLHQE